VSSIDLNSPPPGHEFSVSVERTETDGERWVRLFKDIVLFVVTIVFVSLIGWLCFHTLDSAESSPDAKRWAQSVLSAAAGGLIGYLIKK
jgi:H+/Cl- antiporter ClcA